MPFALGLIETVGLTAAIEALDTALKTADVTALEIENSRGSGRQTVKIAGSVSAVNAAVEAGTEAARKIGIVYATTVIARPSGELEKYLRSLWPTDDQPPTETSQLTDPSVDAADESVKPAEPAEHPVRGGRKTESAKSEKRRSGKNIQHKTIN